MAEKKISYEDRLVLLLSRLTVDSFNREELSMLLSAPLDWERVLETAIQHQVSPFGYYQLNKLNLSNKVPLDTWDKFKNHYYSNITRNTKLWLEFSCVLKAINEAGITVILLKGSILMEEVYRNLGLRTISDIDILVKENEMPKVEDILLKSGYKELRDTLTGSFTEFLFSKSILPDLPLIVDMHKTVVAAKPYKIILSDLWQRAQTKSINGQRVTFLSREDTFLSCSLHLRKHTRRLYLKFITDIDALINVYGQCINWDYIARMAKKNHFISIVYFSLYISKELLNTNIAEEILNRFKPCFLKRKLIYFCMNKQNFLRPERWQGILLRILLFDNPVDILFYIWKVIILEKHLAKQEYRNIIKSFFRRNSSG